MITGDRLVMWVSLTVSLLVLAVVAYFSDAPRLLSMFISWVGGIGFLAIVETLIRRYKSKASHRAG